MRIQWTESAVADLEAIRAYIAVDSDFYAGIFIEKILPTVDILQELRKWGG